MMPPATAPAAAPAMAPYVAPATAPAGLPPVAIKPITAPTTAPTIAPITAPARAPRIAPPTDPILRWSDGSYSGDELMEFDRKKISLVRMALHWIRSRSCASGTTLNGFIRFSHLGHLTRSG